MKSAHSLTLTPQKADTKPTSARPRSGPRGLMALQQQVGNRAFGEVLQRKAEPGAERIGQRPAPVSPIIASGGQPLDAPTRTWMESRFQADFGAVRIHSDSNAAESAQSVRALAYTVGDTIVFGRGQYAPGTSQGQQLLAHELAHTLQQKSAGGTALSGSESHLEAEADHAARAAIAGRALPPLSPAPTSVQKQGDDGEAHYTTVVFATPLASFRVEAPTLEDARVMLIRLGLDAQILSECKVLTAEGRWAFQHPKYGNIASVGIETRTEGGQTKFGLQGSFTPVSRQVGPATGTAGGGAAAEVKPTPPAGKGAGGPTPSTNAPEQAPKATPEQKAAELKALPPDIKELMGGEGSFKPQDYDQLLRIAAKLRKLSPQDLATYKLVPKEIVTDINAFEKSVDTFVALKEQIQQNIQKEAQKAPAEPKLEDKLAKTWENFDASKLAGMDAPSKEQLAREIASERTKIQLKHMATHPGETAIGMAEGVVRVDKLASAFVDDCKEVADGNASGYARMAAISGAGGKLSQFIAAAAGITVIVLLFIPGVNVATLLTVATAALVSSIVFSAIEADLRIKAAGEAKTPEEFQKQTDKASAAQVALLTQLALFAVALVLKLVAKIPLGAKYQNVGNALKMARTAIAQKTGLSNIKIPLLERLRASKAGLKEALDKETKTAGDQAAKVKALPADQLVDAIAKGDPDLQDLGVSAEQAKGIQEAAKNPGGSGAAEQLKAALVKGLQDAPVEVAKKVDTFNADVDQAIQEVDQAKTEGELQAAIDKAEQKVDPKNLAVQTAAEKEAYVAKRLADAAAEPTPKEAAAQAKAQAEAAAEALVKAEEAAAEKWLEELSKSLSAAGKRRLTGIRKSLKTAREARELVQSKGGQDFLEGKLEPPKVVSEPGALGTFKALESDPAFLSRPGVQKAFTLAGEQAENAMRSELTSEIALRRARAAAAGKAGTRIYEGVKVLREQPGFKTVDEFKAANPEYRGPAYQRGAKVYKPSTDIDLLVTENTGGPTETIRQLQEIKSGVNDTPGKAQAQLTTAQSDLKSLANGDPQVRIELADGTDVTSRFDASSAGSAKTVTSGPISAKGTWTESFGVTSDDLLAIAKDILKKAQGPQ